MQLQLQTFTTLVQNMAAAVQSAATQLLDITVGSTLRAVLEANASIALWMQWLILQVLQITRAATSSGADLDSWMSDFSVSRLPALSAGGTVTLSRFTASIAAFIPVGAFVRTADGTQTFAVSADPSNSSFNIAQNGYSLGAGTIALNVAVQAVVPGTAGNILAGAVSRLATAVPGIDTVTNAHPFVNGLDSEADSALRTRFREPLKKLYPTRCSLRFSGCWVGSVGCREALPSWMGSVSSGR